MSTPLNFTFLLILFNLINNYQITNFWFILGTHTHYEQRN